MAAIDEGDMVRTIYDGSFGGANSHIKQNTLEKTTAPTVLDCVHGIHWLQAASHQVGSQPGTLPTEGVATAGGVDSPEAPNGQWLGPNQEPRCSF